MFTSVRIQNFRQFRDLKLEGLGQINLITGANDTGKTSLLEALFLLTHPTEPERTLTVARLRGLGEFGAESADVWGWLFRDRDVSQTISLSAQQTGSQNAHLTIRVSGEREISVTNGQPSVGVSESILPGSSLPVPGLDLEYSDSTDTRVASRVRWTGQTLRSEAERQIRLQPSFFLSAEHRPSEDDAIRWTQVEDAGRDASVVDALRILEPRLQRLGVRASPHTTSVGVDLGIRPLVPLAMMGAGFSRLLTMTEAVILTDSGTVLVDEFGAGFHYSALTSVWQAVIKAAVKHSVQIFATTHSWECIEAAVKASEDHEGSLGFIRLERRNGDIEPVIAPDRRLRSAVRVGFELR